MSQPLHRIRAQQAGASPRAAASHAAECQRQMPTCIECKVVFYGLEVAAGVLVGPGDGGPAWRIKVGSTAVTSSAPEDSVIDRCCGHLELMI